jgi:hypothetical protein
MLREKDRAEVYKVAVNAALGSFLFGYELVNISPLQLLFQNKNHLSNAETRTYLSLMTAALPLMAILGTMIATQARCCSDPSSSASRAGSSWCTWMSPL